MEVGKRMEMLERKSSIEREPMTLHLEQMVNAREEAMFVFKTKTTEEAMDIFTKDTREGLRGDEKRGGRCMNLKDDDDHHDDDEDDEIMMFMSPHGWNIATAPF